MTSVTLFQGPQGIQGFACSGHSGFSASGTDIVCAAVSALTLTCVNALESVAGIRPQVVQRPKDGFLQVTLPENLTGNQQHDAQVLLKALRQGIGDIQDQYPKYVHLSIQERRNDP